MPFADNQLFFFLLHWHSNCRSFAFFYHSSILSISLLRFLYASPTQQYSFLSRRMKDAIQFSLGSCSSTIASCLILCAMCVCAAMKIYAQCVYITSSSMVVRLVGASICIQLCVWCLLVGRERERERKQERYIVVSRDFHTVVPVHISSKDKGTGKEKEDDDDEERNMIARR